MAIVCLLLLIVCFWDYKSRRIPNVFIITIFMYGEIYGYHQGGRNGATEYLFRSLLLLIVMYPLFKIGTIGAGDVKLLSATASFMSSNSIFYFLLYSLLIAALFSLVKIIINQNGKERFFYLCFYIFRIGQTGKWSLYHTTEKEWTQSSICLSGPVLISALLFLGGVY